MRGLTILVVTADPARFHAALSVAAAQAALGGGVRVYLHAGAVALLGTPADDACFNTAGLPDLTELRAEVAAMGVRLIACQSGLALAGFNLADIGDDIDAGGLVGLLANLGEDRLAVF